MHAEAAEPLARLARELLRPEALATFQTAWDWAAPRMRTPEEARLTAALLLMLNGHQALVVPRRLAPGVSANLHVSGARSVAGGPLRSRLFLYVTPDGVPPPDADPECLCFSATDARDTPLQCAARALGKLLSCLLDADEGRTTNA